MKDLRTKPEKGILRWCGRQTQSAWNCWFAVWSTNSTCLFTWSFFRFSIQVMIVRCPFAHPAVDAVAQGKLQPVWG